jgi:hypothetical protein
VAVSSPFHASCRLVGTSRASNPFRVLALSLRMGDLSIISDVGNIYICSHMGYEFNCNSGCKPGWVEPCRAVESWLVVILQKRGAQQVRTSLASAVRNCFGRGKHVRHVSSHSPSDATTFGAKNLLTPEKHTSVQTSVYWDVCLSPLVRRCLRGYAHFPTPKC